MRMDIRAHSALTSYAGTTNRQMGNLLGGTGTSEETNLRQIVVQYHLVDIVKYFAYATGVGGHREVIVALALCILVHEITGGTFHRLLCDVDQLLLDELFGPVTFVETALRLRAIAEILEFRKIIYDMLAGADLTLHDVLLIEENNKAGRGKETILPNTPEEIQCLYQAILSGILA